MKSYLEIQEIFSEEEKEVIVPSIEYDQRMPNHYEPMQYGDNFDFAGKGRKYSGLQEELKDNEKDIEDDVLTQDGESLDESFSCSETHVDVYKKVTFDEILIDNEDEFVDCIELKDENNDEDEFVDCIEFDDAKLNAFDGDQSLNENSCLNNPIKAKEFPKVDDDLWTEDLVFQDCHEWKLGIKEQSMLLDISTNARHFQRAMNKSSTGTSLKDVMSKYLRHNVSHLHDFFEQVTKYLDPVCVLSDLSSKNLGDSDVQRVLYFDSINENFIVTVGGTSNLSDTRYDISGLFLGNKDPRIDQIVEISSEIIKRAIDNPRVKAINCVGHSLGGSHLQTMTTIMSLTQLIMSETGLIDSPYKIQSNCIDSPSFGNYFNKKQNLIPIINACIENVAKFKYEKDQKSFSDSHNFMKSNTNKDMNKSRPMHEVIGSIKKEIRRLEVVQNVMNIVNKHKSEGSLFHAVSFFVFDQLNSSSISNSYNVKEDEHKILSIPFTSKRNIEYKEDRLFCSINYIDAQHSFVGPILGPRLLCESYMTTTFKLSNVCLKSSVAEDFELFGIKYFEVDADTARSQKLQSKQGTLNELVSLSYSRCLKSKEIFAAPIKSFNSISYCSTGKLNLSSWNPIRIASGVAQHLLSSIVSKKHLHPQNLNSKAHMDKTLGFSFEVLGF